MSIENGDDRDSIDSNLDTSRRRLIEALGVGVTLGVAGCQTDTRNTGTNQPNQAQDQQQDQTQGGRADAGFVMPTKWNPQNFHFNPFSTTNRWPIYTRWVAYAMPMALSQKTGEILPFLVQDFSVEDNVLTLNLSDQYGWSNGDQVTSEDWKMWFGIRDYLKPSDSRTWEAIETPDDTTLRLTRAAGPINGRLFAAQELYGIHSYLYTPRAMYREYYDRFQDAEGNESQRNNIMADLQEWTPGLDEAVFSGPYKVTKLGGTKAILEPNENHPYAESKNWQRTEFQYADSMQVLKQLQYQGQVDAAGAYLPSQLSLIPDKYKQLSGFKNVVTGVALEKNQKHLRNRKVRKALSYLIDREQVASNILGQTGIGTTVTLETGVQPHVLSNWLNEKERQNMENYGSGSRPERAAELLRSAGYTKQDGDWFDPDGERMSLPFVSQSGRPQFTSIGQTFSSTLSEFGIQSEHRTRSGSTYESSVRSEHDFTLAAEQYGRFQPHPYFSYVHHLYGDKSRSVWVSDSYLENFEEPWLARAEYEVPYPIGDPDGDLQNVNVHEKIDNLFGSQSEEEAQELVSELSWIWNQLVPHLGCVSEGQYNWINAEKWSFPWENEKLASAWILQYRMHHMDELSYSGQS